MLIVSMFFGIVIRMFCREHGVPLSHAEYQGQVATIAFDGQVLAGRIEPRTALRLIQEWAALHSAELEAHWLRGKAGKPLERISPLE